MNELTKLRGRPKIRKVKIVSENQLKLFWTEVEGADKYAVFILSAMNDFLKNSLEYFIISDTFLCFY